MNETRGIIKTPIKEAVEIERPFDHHEVSAGRYPGYSGTLASDSLQLLDYWRAIRKRLWLVIGIAVLITTLTAIYMARKPNIYSARAVVQIDNEQTNPDLVTSDRQRPISASDPAYFNTQLQLLWSDGLLRRAIKEHNLDSNKDFQQAKAEGSISPWRAMLKSIGLASDDSHPDKTGAQDPVTGNSSIATTEEVAEAVRLAPYVNIIHRDLGIEPIRDSRTTFKDTRLIEITFRHSNPDLAAFVANAIAETFTNVNQEKRSGTSRKTNDFLSDRIANLQAEIKNDEERYVQLTQNAGILKSGEGEQ